MATLMLEGPGEKPDGAALKVGRGSLPRVAASAVDFVALQGPEGCSLAEVWAFFASRAELAPWAERRKAAVWRVLLGVPASTLTISPAIRAQRAAPPPTEDEEAHIRLVASERARLQALRIPFADTPGTEAALQLVQILASTLGKGAQTSEAHEKLSASAKGSLAMYRNKAVPRQHYIFDGLEELMLIEKATERKDSGSHNRLRHVRFSSREYVSEYAANDTIKASETLRGMAYRVVAFLVAARKDLGISRLAYSDVLYLLNIKSRTLWTFLEQEWKAGRSFVEPEFVTIRLMGAQDRRCSENFFARIAQRARRHSAIQGERRIVILRNAPLATRGQAAAADSANPPAQLQTATGAARDEAAAAEPNTPPPQLLPATSVARVEAAAIARQTLGMPLAGAVHGVSIAQQLQESVLAAGSTGISTTEMSELAGLEPRIIARVFHRMQTGGGVAAKATALAKAKGKVSPSRDTFKVEQSRSFGKYNAVGVATASEDARTRYCNSLLARERSARVERLRSVGLLEAVEPASPPVKRKDRLLFRLNVVLSAINALGAVTVRRLQNEIREQEIGVFDGECDVWSVRRLVERCNGDDAPPGMPKLCIMEWSPATREATEVAAFGDATEAAASGEAAETAASGEATEAAASQGARGPPAPPALSDSAEGPPLPPGAIDEELKSEKTSQGAAPPEPTRQEALIQPTPDAQPAEKNQETKVVEMVCRADRVPRPEVFREAAKEKGPISKAAGQQASGPMVPVVRLPAVSFLTRYARGMRPGETAEDVFERLDAAAEEALRGLERITLDRAGRRNGQKLKRKGKYAAAQARLRKRTADAQGPTVEEMNLTNFPERIAFDRNLLTIILRATHEAFKDPGQALDYYYEYRLMVRARLLYGFLLEYSRAKLGAPAPAEVPIALEEVYKAMPMILYLRIVKRPIAAEGGGPMWGIETCKKAIEVALQGGRVQDANCPELAAPDLEDTTVSALREISLLARKTAPGDPGWILLTKARLRRQEYDAQNDAELDEYWWVLWQHLWDMASRDKLCLATSWAFFANRQRDGPEGGRRKGAKSRKRKRAAKQRGAAQKKRKAVELLEPLRIKPERKRRGRIEPWPLELAKAGFEAYFQNFDMNEVTAKVFKTEAPNASPEHVRKKLRAALEGAPDRVDVLKIASANVEAHDRQARIWGLRNAIILHLVQLARQKPSKALDEKLKVVAEPLRGVEREFLADILEELVTCGFLRGFPTSPTPQWPQYLAANIDRDAFRLLLRRVGSDMHQPRRIQSGALKFARGAAASGAAGAVKVESLGPEVSGADLMRVLPLIALGEATLDVDYKVADGGDSENPPLMESERSRRAPRVPVSELKNTEELFAIGLRHLNCQDEEETRALRPKRLVFPPGGDEAADADARAALLGVIAEAGENGIPEAQARAGKFSSALAQVLASGEVLRVPAFHQYRYVLRAHAKSWVLGGNVFGLGASASAQGPGAQSIGLQDPVVMRPWLRLDGREDEDFKRSLSRAVVVYVLDYPGTSRKALAAAFYPILDLAMLELLLEPLLQGPDALLEVHAEHGVECLAPSLRALDKDYLLPDTSSPGPARAGALTAAVS